MLKLTPRDKINPLHRKYIMLRLPTYTELQDLVQDNCQVLIFRIIENLSTERYVATLFFLSTR